MSKRTKAVPLAPQTLTASEVAQVVGIDRGTLYRWLDREIFPAPTIKVGRTVRWSKKVVDEFVDKGVTEEA
jgi:excisionase family DNA binding protein